MKASSHLTTLRRRPLLLAGLLLLASFLSNLSLTAKDDTVSLNSYEPWPEEVVESFNTLLVQDSGRVKPIYTMARFTLLQFSGKSSVRFTTGDGQKHKISHSEFMLDLLFRGQIARELPLFVVDDSAAVVQVGLTPKSKRDRYSYSELTQGDARARFSQLGAQYGQKQQQFNDTKLAQHELERVETMVLTLARNINAFEYYGEQLAYARQSAPVINAGVLPPEFREMAERLDMADMLEQLPEMSFSDLERAAQQPVGDDPDSQMLMNGMRLFWFQARSAVGINMFPPTAAEDEIWKSGGDLLIQGLSSKEARPQVVEQIRSIQALCQSLKQGGDAFGEEMANFVAKQKEAAATRGEGQRAALEVHLYERKYFTYSLYVYVLAFLVLAFGWLSPGSSFGRTSVIIVCALALLGFLLTTTGITLRCIIRDRPPITNLYDTVLFITATAVLLALIIEYFTKVGVGALLAVFSGMAGMFLSIKYEAREATDTMEQLIAVLDTNFWLATHVTIINVGYAAGLLSCFIGLVYLIALIIQTLTHKTDKPFLRMMTRMNYGIICFCLFFSLVGTVLGGIWANYSWGRFWGWDPKENGALMICLWTLVMLHGRFAGWIREVGVNVCGVVLGMIVTFSWWGVNNLGVGLHSYGFTDGVWGVLFSSWAIMGVIAILGVVASYLQKMEQGPGKLGSGKRQKAK